MTRPQNHSQESKRSTKKTVLKIILALIVALVVLTYFIVPGFISSEKGRRLILSKINGAVDGQTDFAGLSMSWWRGLTVDNISYRDVAGRTSVDVKKIATRPHYGALLSGDMSFGKTVIDEPRVSINLKDNPPRPSSPRQSGRGNGNPNPVVLPIKEIDLVVNSGSVKVTSPQARAVELANINSRVNLRPPGSKSDFNVNMTVTEKGKTADVSAEGSVTPGAKTGWALKGTTGNLSVKIKDLDLASIEPLLALAGVEIETRGKVSADMNSRINDGQIENLTAAIKGKNIDVTGPPLKGDRVKTETLDANIKLSKDKDLVNIDKLDVKSDWLNAQASGAVPMSLESWEQLIKPDTDFSLTAAFQCDLGLALSQMPRTLGVKEQMKVTAGSLTGQIETTAQKGAKQIKASADLVGLKGIIEGKAIELPEPVVVDALITSDKTGIKYDKLNVSAPFAKIDCSGTSERVQYAADINLEKLQQQFGQFIDTGPYQVAGRLSSRGTISGNKDKIAAAGSSSINDFLFSKDNHSAAEPKADIDFDVNFDRKTKVLDIGQISARADMGFVTVKDSTVPFGEKQDEPTKLALAVSNLNLKKVKDFAQLFVPFFADKQLSGIAESKLTYLSSKERYSIKTTDTKIKDFKFSYPEKQPFEQSEVVLVLDFEADRTTGAKVLKDSTLTSPQIEAAWDYDERTQNGRTSIKGNADCKYDWAAVSSVAAPFLPGGLELHGKRETALRFTSEYPADQPNAMLANLNAQTKLGFDSADYMGLHLGPVETQLKIENGLFTLDPFSTTLNNGQLNFAANADFKQKPTLLRTPKPIHIVKNVEINDEVGRNMLMFINPVFWKAFNLDGLADFNCQKLAIPLAEGAKKDLEVVGTVAIDRLHLQPTGLLGKILPLIGTGAQGQTIKIHPTEFALREGFLRYDDMQMDIGNNPVNFKGVIGIEDRSLNMNVTLPYTTGGRTARAGEEAEGRRISVPLTGTIDKPEFKVDVFDLGRQILEDRLRKNGKQGEQTDLREKMREKLRKEIQGLFK